MDIVAELRKNPFVLAPMAAITDSPFRSFMREMGAGIVISELVSAYGIQYGSPRTLELMAYTEDQRPVGIQIFGEDPDVLSRAAVTVQESGADFVDINLGCPVPKVVKKGAGAALLREPEVLHGVLKKVKAALDIPLTIKIRTGWDDKSINAKQIVNAAADAGVTWVAIHGRTRAQGYAGSADWDLIGEVKASAPIPIIGNGDILTAERACQRLHDTGCDGVMIGRGALKNPWIFRQALALHHRAHSPFDRNFCSALARLKYFIDDRKDARYSLLQMKKFVAWFSSGYPGSQSFRKQLFDMKDSDSVLECATNYFGPLDWTNQADTSHEAFLMGGHG